METLLMNDSKDSFEDVNDLVRNELYKGMDENFGRELAQRLPECGNIIGVPLPKIMEIAEEIAGINWKEYLKHALDDTLEETLLQGLVLCYAQGKLEEILAYADEFIPKIDNWWVCDSFCSAFKVGELYPDIVWEFVMKYMGDSDLYPQWRKEKAGDSDEKKGNTGVDAVGENVTEESVTDENKADSKAGIITGTWQDMSDDFRIRFVSQMLRRYYVNDKYIDRTLYALAHLQDGGYYAKSGVAMALAECFTVFPDKTEQFMRENEFDETIINLAGKALQQIYRATEEAQARFMKNSKPGK
jgi:hypothetical protein